LPKELPGKNVKFLGAIEEIISGL